VTDDAYAAARLRRLGATVVPDAPRRGLNAALAHGADILRRSRPAAGVAALNAELPALRPAELARALRAASGHARSFLPDAAGVGASRLVAAPGAALALASCGALCARHRASGAAELTLAEVDGVRRDVDDGEHLRAALRLGVGPQTAGVLDAVGVVAVS